MKGFKQLWAWAKANKVQAWTYGIGFFVSSILIGTAGALWTHVIAIAGFILLLAMFVHELRYTLLLACLLALPSHAEEPRETAAVAAGVVVVVVGGVVVVSLVKFCKKAYAPKTNAPPELSLSGEGSSAASDLYFSEYCSDGSDLSLAPSMDTTETVVSGRAGSIQLVTNTCSKSEYIAAMNSIGLPLQFGRQYASHGRPASQWDTPILFGESLGAVPHVTITGDGSVTSVVFRSLDCRTWTPILTNTAPKGMELSFTDNVIGQSAFYRTVRQ